jgi:hypothetical protein
MKHHASWAVPGALCIVTMTGLAVIAVGALVTAAIAGDLPKEGTWRGKAAVEGKWTINKIGTDETTGLIVFDRTSTMEGDSPMAREHCFGVLELVNKVSAAAGPKLPERVIKPHGYCIDVDADGDQIVFKDANEERPWSSSSGPSHSEIVMGTGKYAGITGTSVATCLFGGSMPSTGSSPTSHQMRCDVETTYKLP